MKRIILKINENGSIEPFSQLPELFEVYPELEKHKESINSYLSRQKKPCPIFDGFTLTRQIVNSKEIVFS